MPTISMGLQTYLEQLVDKRSVRGCWIWRGATKVNQASRYPVVRLQNGRYASARRVFYSAFCGDPPLGRYVVESSCGNALCVNPDHLSRGERLKGGRTPPDVTFPELEGV